MNAVGAAQRTLRRCKAVYLKIKEPRISRLSHFFMYFITTIAGFVAVMNLPTLLVHLIGPTMLAVFGIFSISGSLLALVSVLPSIWWLERVGIILLLTAVVMYIVMLIYTGVTVIALWFAAALAISLAQRWYDIKYDPC